jgi:RecB family exonuclease
VRSLQIRTTIIEGPLAYQMRRADAARANECGLQILNLPQLAARLAGGFITPVTVEQLDLAIQRALEEGGFVELESARHLPGMTRAVSRSLRKVWNAGVRLDVNGVRAGRIGDLALIEARVRRHLPGNVMLPHDLRNAAVARIGHAARVVGPVTIERLSFIPPNWRLLIEALAKNVPIEWQAPDCALTDWFSGSITRSHAISREPLITAVSCADPRHEVVESLRWARQLVASGKARPQEIAIAAAGPSAWDDHFLAATDAGLRLHFVHGTPALASRDGQRAAALADVLLHGLSQSRVRRLASLGRGDGGAFNELPREWLSSIPRGAALAKVEDWRRAISTAVLSDVSLAGIKAALPILEVLAKGIAAANEAGELLLRGRSAQLWQAALRTGPPDAIEFALQNARFPSENDAANSIAWCSARDLASAPRPYTRLLGLTNRGWPRRSGEDSILPDHVMPASEFDIDPTARADRRHFEAIVGGTACEIVLSRSRRSAQGSRVGRSPLLQDRSETSLSRARVPEHAWNESDRLMARPPDAARIPRIGSAKACWTGWHEERLTPYDAQFPADHPAMRRAIGRVQSATSLRLMLQDPLGFVWRYALGWRTPEEREQPLSIAPDVFGKLVHELLRRAVDTLEPEPGYARASDQEIEDALANAARVIRDGWPLEGPVPPSLLWQNTVDYAAALALVGLLRKDIAETSTRSWTEVPFGQPENFVAGRELPWNPTAPVSVPNTPILLRGTIDRLDLRTAPAAVRVTDYKTGEPPKNAARIVIGGGSELQRALYGLACRTLLPDDPKIVARLLYLRGDQSVHRLEDIDGAIEQIAAFANFVVALLMRGIAVPGLAAFELTNDLRLALPASPGYYRRKRLSFGKAGQGIEDFWRLA